MQRKTRDTLANDRRYHGDARHAVHRCNNDRVQPFVKIDLNNRSTRQTRTVQAGFKELPIAMG